MINKLVLIIVGTINLICIQNIFELLLFVENQFVTSASHKNTLILNIFIGLCILLYTVFKLKLVQSLLLYILYYVLIYSFSYLTKNLQVEIFLFGLLNSIISLSITFLVFEFYINSRKKMNSLNKSIDE